MAAKIIAIVLVVGVAGYALYELFAGNLGNLGLPGQNTASGASVPGQPAYSNVAQPSNNQSLGNQLSLSTASTLYSDAFGATGNQGDDSETDSSDMDDDG
jgi:hypothetical protein